MAFAYFNPNPVYRPQVLEILDITQANPAEVTTSFNHNYLTGTIVRLHIPLTGGMYQLAGGEQWPITVTGALTFTIPVDSTFFDTFMPAQINSPDQPSQVFPVGEINEMLTMASTNIT